MKNLLQNVQLNHTLDQALKKTMVVKSCA